VVTGFDGADPLSAVVAAEDARFAAMVVLESLSPDQRVAFVLHDGFSVPFAEVVEVLGTSLPAARQRRLPRDAAADYGHHGARRKGLRPMGYRQSRQVHRLSAAVSAHGTRQASPELKPSTCRS
jgi:hypothetical protein